VDERQAQQIAYAGLAPYVQPGLEVASENLTFTRGEIQQMEPGGHITFLMIVEGNVAVSIDPDRVRRRLAGTSLGEARHRLERDLLLDPGRPPQITTWPGWFRRLPWLPVRITVQVQTP